MSSAGIRYIIGDATTPVGEGHKIITHCCNDIGAWGKGFVLALSKRWNFPERAYKEWYRTGFWFGIRFELGQLQTVDVKPDITVANFIGQHGLSRWDGIPPIRYEAFQHAFVRLQMTYDGEQEKVSFHMPRIGCGLAGGKWEKVEKIISDELVDHGFSVIVYDLK